MRRLHLQLLAVVGLGLFAATGAAALDTATKLRLQSIEARLPDADEVARLKTQVHRLAAAQGIDLPQADSDPGSGSSAARGSGGNDAMFSLLQRVQSLEQDVRNLRGQIEDIQHKVDQNNQRQQDLYKNLDARIKTLEQQEGIANGAVGAQPNAAAPANPTGSAGNGAAPTDEASVKQAYLAAFAQLKSGKYAAARQSFTAFTQNHPNSSYSDNAWYWLGEARYVDRQYDDALSAFRHLVNSYPHSNKVPGANYKIGVILDEQGDSAQARQQLNSVIRNFPNDNAAQLAKQRLQAMGNAGNH